MSDTFQCIVFLLGDKESFADCIVFLTDKPIINDIFFNELKSLQPFLLALTLVMKPKKALKKSFHKLILILNHKSLFTQPYSWGSTNLLDSILVVKLCLIELVRKSWSTMGPNYFWNCNIFIPVVISQDIFFEYLLIDFTVRKIVLKL